MRKRQKMVLVSLFLAAGMYGIQVAPLEWRTALILLGGGVTWVGVAWALAEGLSGVEWVTVTLPMVLFTLGMGFFSVLLPQQTLARLAVLVVFCVGQYALILTGNIFSVAAIRTIALFRAAAAVGYAMTIFSGFLLYDTVLSFRGAFWANGLAGFTVSFFLLLSALWSAEIEEKISWKVWQYSFFLALAIGLFALAVSFWPVGLTVASLFLTTMLYVYLGIAQHHFSRRLYAKTVWEYVTIGGAVLVTVLLTAILL